LWHEFILDTQAYAAFCHRAFGRFFHHVPSGGLGLSKFEDDALQRTWRLACLAERMHPRKPAHPPLLFAVDRKVAVAGALAVTLSCTTGERGKCGGGSGGCSGGCGGGGCGGC
jgi:hypothetical protein